MWRNALSGNRDMYVATSNDGGNIWDAAKKVGNESWKLDACPMDGGGITLTGSAKSYAVFRKDKEIHYSTPAPSSACWAKVRTPRSHPV
jgi:hypothetical protein